MGNRTDDKTQEINRISMMDRNKTSYKEGKKEENRIMSGIAGIYVQVCLSQLGSDRCRHFGAFI